MTPPWTAIAAITLSAFLAAAFLRPGLWGFGGAMVYASGQLGAAIFNEAGQDPQFVRKAWLQFATALFFGAIAAEAFGPSISDLTHNAVRPQAVWLVVGLSANGMWPVLERLIGKRLADIARAFMGERP